MNMNRTVSPEMHDRKLRLATMRLSIVEGLFAMIAIGFQQTFYVPFLNAPAPTSCKSESAPVCRR
jgi:hypothetical protein